MANDPAVVTAYLGTPKEKMEVAPVLSCMIGKLLLEVKNLFAGYAGSVILNGVRFTV